VFVAGSVGQYINATPQGRAKIVRFNSGTSVDAITEFPFFATGAIAADDWSFELGYENVWSSIRGWPNSVTFHEGRLYFGGSKSRPSTVWGSRVGDFFNFEAGEGLDDESVEATLDTNTFNSIVDIISGRDLQVFTTGGEFYCPQDGLQPITPSSPDTISSISSIVILPSEPASRSLPNSTETIPKIFNIPISILIIKKN
jgi:hypothetical protein